MVDLSWEEIQRIALAEIKRGEQFVERSISPDRTQRWDRYYGRPLGNEVKGRSQFMSRDMMETIEWIMPTLIRTFASGDPKVDIFVENQPPVIGQALVKKIQDDIDRNREGNLFMLFYQWFKDGLVSGTSFIKVFWEKQFGLREISFPQLQYAQMKQLEMDPDVEIIGFQEGQDMVGLPVYTDVKATVKTLTQDRLVADNIPHWEFITTAQSRDVNDNAPKTHITEVTLDYLKRVSEAFTESDDEPYFKNLDRLERDDGDSTRKQDSERTQYMDHEDDSEDMPDTDGGKGKKIIKLSEHYTQLDVNNDGYLEDCTIWFGNDVMLRYEINDDDLVPICSIKPVVDCYKSFGIAWAALLEEIQNLKTVMIRRLLDNFDFQNSGRWFRKPGAVVDIRALLDNVPGGVVTADPDSLVNVAPQPFHPSNLTFLDYIDNIKEQRTGSTKYNQGQDSDSLNKTATGIQMIQSAAQQRIELIARVFAETGLVDFYRKSALLYQKYLTKPFTISVKGQQVQVTPEMLQGEIYAKVNMGVEAQVGVVESQKLERLLGIYMNLSERFPGLVGPEQIHNFATRIATSMGFQAENFAAPMEAFMQSIQGAQQQSQQMQQMQMGMQQQSQQLEVADLQSKNAIDIERVKQKDRDSERDAQVALMGIKAQMMNRGGGF